MKSSNDCTCASPHVDCWSSRCRHEALKVLQAKCDELKSRVHNAECAYALLAIDHRELRVAAERYLKIASIFNRPGMSEAEDHLAQAIAKAKELQQ